MKSRRLTVLLISLSLILGVCTPGRVEAKGENEKKEVINQINQMFIGNKSYYVLGRDGSVWSAGFDALGRLGWGESNSDGNKGELRVIPSAKNIVGISANTLVSYGINGYGDIFHWHHYKPGEILKSIKKTKTFIAGDSFNVALTKEGRVWTWGQNSLGQLGLGDSNYRSEPTLIPNLDDVVEIVNSPISDTVYALKRDGTVWGWGRNDNYQLGKSGDNSLVPTQINFPTKIKHIYQSNGDSPFVYGAAIDENNSVWWWGKGYLSKVKPSIYGEPVVDQGIKSVKQLALGQIMHWL